MKGVLVMGEPIRVMVEQGKKRAVVSAFDWPDGTGPAPSADALPHG